MHKQHCSFNQYNTCTAGISIESSNFFPQYVWDVVTQKNTHKDAEIGLAITSNGICIFDDGKKITKNEKEKIFEKGFRGSAAKKKDGTGVGLFLARKLAKHIGGELRLLENNAIDNTEKLKNLKKKNIFYLELPIKELHA